MIASRQHGVFSVEQARQAGFDKYAIGRRRESGQWIRLAPTVYAVASAPPKWERQVAAAVLSRRRAVVGGATAAYLHGFPGIRRAQPVIVVPETANARSDLGRVIRHRRFEKLHTARVGGFAVTAVEETIVLLARDVQGSRLETLFDDLLIAQKLDLGKLSSVIKREESSRVAGLGPVKSLAQDRSPSAPAIKGSYLERTLESLLRAHGIGGWTREFPFSIRGHAARVDFHFPGEMIVLEADGRSWHMRSEDFEADRRRDNELAARGIHVLRFTYRMLTEEPEGAVDSIRRTLHSRRRIVASL